MPTIMLGGLEAKMEPKIPEEAEEKEAEEAEDDESFVPKRSEAKVDDDDPPVPVDEQPVRFSPSISLSLSPVYVYRKALCVIISSSLLKKEAKSVRGV